MFLPSEPSGLSRAARGCPHPGWLTHQRAGPQPRVSDQFLIQQLVFPTRFPDNADATDLGNRILKATRLYRPSEVRDTKSQRAIQLTTDFCANGMKTKPNRQARWQRRYPPRSGLPRCRRPSSEAARGPRVSAGAASCFVLPGPGGKRGPAAGGGHAATSRPQGGGTELMCTMLSPFRNKNDTESNLGWGHRSF